MIKDDCCGRRTTYSDTLWESFLLLFNYDIVFGIGPNSHQYLLFFISTRKNLDEVKRRSCETICFAEFVL